MVMERKIGEIFGYKGEWYQCVKSNCEDCIGCDFCNLDNCKNAIGECTSNERSDNNSVIFKKLEKVGVPCRHHPFMDYREFVMLQKYRVPYVPVIRPVKPTVYLSGDVGESDIVAIKIEQQANTEDTEANKEKENI